MDLITENACLKKQVASFQVENENLKAEIVVLKAELESIKAPAKPTGKMVKMKISGV